MKPAVYINQAFGDWPKRENGKWTIDELIVTMPPTKCKVTINKTIVVPDVYVWCKEGENICLYREFEAYRTGWGAGDRENCWPAFRGKGLVLEFKSDDFVIEAV